MPAEEMDFVQVYDFNKRGFAAVDGCRISVKANYDIEYHNGMDISMPTEEVMQKYLKRVGEYAEKNPGEDTDWMANAPTMIAGRDPAIIGLLYNYRRYSPARWLFAQMTGLSLTFIAGYDEGILRRFVGEASNGVVITKKKRGPSRRKTTEEQDGNGRVGDAGNDSPRSGVGDAVVAAERAQVSGRVA